MRWLNTVLYPELHPETESTNEIALSVAADQSLSYNKNWQTLLKSHSPVWSSLNFLLNWVSVVVMVLLTQHMNEWVTPLAACVWNQWVRKVLFTRVTNIRLQKYLIAKDQAEQDAAG